jgi:glycerol-3-phosphate dehydrogenase
MSVFRALFSQRNLLLASGGTAFAVGGGYYYLNSGPVYPLSTKEHRHPPPAWTPPCRDYMLSALKASGSIRTQGLRDDVFDLLVVGGGATGAGVAVDAASRGLKVALIERDDFSAGMNPDTLVAIFVRARDCDISLPIDVTGLFPATLI